MKKRAKRAAAVEWEEFRKHVTVTVSRDPRNAGGAVVEPKVVRVLHGGTVRFKSGVGRLIVFIPTPARTYVPFRSLRKGLFLALGSRGKKLTVMKLKGKKPRPREYVYAVYCPKLRTFAHASLPKMIVGP